MLSKTWDTPRGRPTLAGSAELELLRLRMGLSPDKAQEIEYEVRIKLAEQSFYNLDDQFLDFVPKQSETQIVTPQATDKYNTSLQEVGRAIRLDGPTALRLFQTIITPSLEIDLHIFSKQLINANKIWVYQEDRELFEWFLSKLR